jgi:hypothetical protein
MVAVLKVREGMLRRGAERRARNLLHERLEDADGLVVAATFVQGLAQIEARAKRVLAESGLPQR